MELDLTERDDIPATNPRPRSRLTFRVRRDVLVDTAAFGMVASRASMPDDNELDRIDAEVTAAGYVFRERGWLDDPLSYHREPPVPTEVRSRRRRSGPIRFTSLTWDDGYAPEPDEPGAARYATYRQNRIARAALLEHRDGDRPWVVAIHGFGMGQPGLDIRALRAGHLHRELGVNVALLTLPFHGRRNHASRLDPPMPSVDVLDTVHGLAQAVWDARQLLALLRARTAAPIGLMGLSLGGLVSALVASVDEPHAAVLLIPAVDLPNLMHDATDDIGRDDERGILARATPLYAPVSPLRLEPRVPDEHRLIVAGTLDRFARPTSQAVELWRHWDEPDLHWYHGGHVSFFWARNVWTAITEKLSAAGLSQK